MKSKFTILAALILLVAGSAAASTTSVDLLEFSSDGSSFYNGTVFILSTTETYDTNTFNFNLDNEEDLQPKVDEGQVQNDISVSIESTETEAVYTLRATDNPRLRLLTPFEETMGVSYSLNQAQIAAKIESEYRNNCYDISGDGSFNGEDYYATVNYGLTERKINVHCVTPGFSLGNVGEISSDPKDIFKTRWVAETDDGKTEDAVISNGDMGDSVVKELGPNVKVRFQGAAATGENSPVPTDEMVLQTSSGFKIIQRGEYNAWRNSRSNLLYDLEQWAKGSYSDGDTVVESINSKARNAAQKHSNSEFLEGSDPDKDGDSEVQATNFQGTGFGDGQLRLSIDELLFPEFQVAARACRAAPGSDCNAFVQIQKTVGEPGIVSSTGDEFTEMNDGTVSVTYENVGNGQGAFEATVTSCSEHFSFSGTSNQSRLDPGSQGSSTFPISFSVSNTTQKTFTGSCTLQVKEVNTGETVSTSVEVQADQKATCTPGERTRKASTVQVNGEQKTQYTIYKCNEAGTGKVEVRKCDPGMDAVPQSDGTFRCSEDPDPPKPPTCEEQGDCPPTCEPITLMSSPFGDVKIPNFICQFGEAFSNPLDYVAGAATLYAFMIGFGLRKPALTIASLSGVDFRAFGRQFKLSWFVGIGFGILCGWAAWTLLSALWFQALMVVLGTVGTALYIYLFGFRSLVMAFLPIGE